MRLTTQNSWRKHLIVAMVALFTVSSAACGSDSKSSSSNSDELVAAIAEKIDDQGDMGLKESEKTCIAQETVDAIGADRLDKLGVTVDNVPEVKDVKFTDDEITSIAKAYTKCADTKALFIEAVSDGDEDVAACLDDSLDNKLMTAIIESGLKDDNDTDAIDEALTPCFSGSSSAPLEVDENGDTNDTNTDTNTGDQPSEALVNALAAELAGGSTGLPMNDDEAKCAATALLSGIGVERLAEIGLSGDSEAATLDLSNDEALTVADAITGCVDVAPLLAQTIADSAQLSSDDATCIAGNLNKDFLDQMIAISMQGGDPTQADGFQDTVTAALTSCGIGQ